MNTRTLLFSVMALFVEAAAGATTIGEAVHDIDVDRQGKSIVAKAEFVVDVPRADVVRAFTSFDRLSELNPAIVSSSAKTTHDGRVEVTTQLRDCVAFFCRSVTLVEKVSIAANGNMTAEIEPANSDFKRGSTAWTFEAEGSRTRVSYRSSMQPDFWMPAPIGKHVMRKALSRQIAASIQNLEKLHSDKPL